MPRDDATYVLPLRTEEPAGEELDAYLTWLSRRVEVIVVDGSPHDVYTAHRATWPGVVRHLRPDPARACANGKVQGVLTGLEAARHDRVIIADDDVRYDGAGLERIIGLLGGYDLVRPQNYFHPLPWHAAWDTGRTLLNRAFGADYPGTLGVRRAVLQRTGGYDGDVLFENLELMRTVAAAGGRSVAPLDLYVRRVPPTAQHFWGQRVRQAYDELARPTRMAGELSFVPLAAWAAANGRRRGLLAALVAVVAIAERGRRRAGGTAVFPARTALMAPLWVAERGVCSWVALASRVLRGGVAYGGGVLTRPATPLAQLRTRAADWGHNAGPRTLSAGPVDAAVSGLGLESHNRPATSAR